MGAVLKFRRAIKWGDVSARPKVGSMVRVNGHFSDPASTTCTLVTFIGEQAISVDRRAAELYCREQFVVDAIEVTGIGPSYTDPYHP